MEDSATPDDMVEGNKDKRMMMMKTRKRKNITEDKIKRIRKRRRR